MNNKFALTEKSLINALNFVNSLNTFKKSDLVVIGTGAFSASIQNGNEAIARFAKTEDIDICISSATIDQLRKFPEERKKHHIDSNFHDKEGFYIDILNDAFIAHLPKGWEDRSKQYDLKSGRKAFALSPLDVASNKLLSYRAKDIDVVSKLIEKKIISRTGLNDIQKHMLESNLHGRQKSLTAAHQLLDLHLSRKKAGYEKRVENFISTAPHPKGSFACAALGIDWRGAVEENKRAELKSNMESLDKDDITAKQFIKNLARHVSKDVKKALARSEERER